MSSFWAGTLVLACALAFRLTFLTADAPPYHPYGTAWGDEGFWNWPAAIRAVQGRRAQADDPWARLAPLYVMLEEAVTSTFGVSLRSIRATSVAAGMLTTLVVMLVATSSVGVEAGLSAGLGYATLFPAIIFERFAIPEALAGLFGAMTLLSVAGKRRHHTAAACWAVAATLCKVSAVPFLPFVASVIFLDRLSPGEPRERRPSIRHALLLMFLLTSPLIFAARGVSSISRLPGGFFEGVEIFARNAISAATTAWYYVGGILWSTGTAILVGFSASRSSDRERRLAVLCGLWAASWFAVVPWIDAKGGRLYLLTVPLVLAGSIGWSRLIESRVNFVALKQSMLTRLRGGVAAIWLLLIAAVFLAEQTRIRARLWIPVLSLFSIAAWQVFMRWRPTMRLAALPRGGRRARWATLVAGALASQLPLSMAWMTSRTYVMASALETARTRFPDRGDVCGQAAAVVLLGKPSMGDAIVPVFRSEDCRTDGRLADYVLLSAQESCLEFPHEWLERNRRTIEAGPVVARVELPGCVYSLYPLADDARAPLSRTR